MKLLWASAQGLRKAQRQNSEAEKQVKATEGLPLSFRFFCMKDPNRLFFSCHWHIQVEGSMSGFLPCLALAEVKAFFAAHLPHEAAEAAGAAGAGGALRIPEGAEVALLCGRGARGVVEGTEGEDGDGPQNWAMAPPTDISLLESRALQEGMRADIRGAEMGGAVFQRRSTPFQVPCLFFWEGWAQRALP